MGSFSESILFIETPPLIGSAHNQNDPCPKIQLFIKADVGFDGHTSSTERNVGYCQNSWWHWNEKIGENDTHLFDILLSKL